MQLPFTEQELRSISYGLMSSFGFMLMLFVYNYCKYNTTARPSETDTQFDAALLETTTSIPFVARIVEIMEHWFFGPLPAPEAADAEETAKDAIKPVVRLPIIQRIPTRIVLRGNIRPIQPKRTVSCPALYHGAAAFSPMSDDGDFFFADLPSPASAP